MNMRSFALRVTVATAAVSLASLAVPLFESSVGADSSNATPAVVNPSTPPLFAQCPAVHDDTGCGVLITLNANGTATFQTDPNQGPFDGSDDTLVGVVNNTGVPIPSINLSSNKGIFAFDGDGICSFAPFTGSNYCSSLPDGAYNGPTSTFSNISGDYTSGTVKFDALPTGSSTYFSLENSLTGADFTIPADFTVAKSITSTGPYIAGDQSTPIDYQIAVHNFGGAPGNIQVTDDTSTSNTTINPGSVVCPTGIAPATCGVTVASGVITWNLLGVPAGATINLTFSVTPNASSTGYPVDNTGKWAGPGCDTDPIGPAPAVTGPSPSVALTKCPTNTTVTDVVPPSANFTVVKAVTSSGPYYAGNTSTPITYSLSRSASPASDCSTTKRRKRLRRLVPANEPLASTRSSSARTSSGVGCITRFSHGALRGAASAWRGSGFIRVPSKFRESRARALGRRG